MYFQISIYFPLVWHPWENGQLPSTSLLSLFVETAVQPGVEYLSPPGFPMWPQSSGSPWSVTSKATVFSALHTHCLPDGCKGLPGPGVGRMEPWGGGEEPESLHQQQESPWASTWRRKTLTVLHQWLKNDTAIGFTQVIPHWGKVLALLKIYVFHSKSSWWIKII